MVRDKGVETKLFNGPGFSVEIVRFHNLRYSEGKHVAVVWGETLRGNPDYVLYANTLKQWEPPFDTEAMSGEDKERIINNLRLALKAWGIKYEVG